MSEQNQIDVFEFVEIPSEPGFEVNRIGQVRKIGCDEVKKLTPHTNGYLRTKCNGHLCLVHRLVAETFIPNPNQLPQVDHINNNRTDNNYTNLRWCSSSENQFNRKLGTEVTEIPREATRIDVIKDCDFEDLFYYNQCFYVNLEYKIRCYRGSVNGKQKLWSIYDINHTKVYFTTKQFLSYWPQFRSDFYPEKDDENSSEDD